MKNWVPVLLAVAAMAAGCSSGSSTGSAVPIQTGSEVTSTTPSATPSVSSMPTTAATNLFFTQDVRAQLLHTKAQAVGVPDSAFVRLYKGSAYYALDNRTGVYWAAASVVPSRTSEKAQVYSQDEGGYNIFVLRPGSDWQMYDAGRDGPDARSGDECPIKIPAAVLRVWHWAPNTCDPPLSSLGN